MKASELIELADELVENPFSTTVKLHLVNEIETRIRTQVLLQEPDDALKITSETMSAADLCQVGRDSLYLAWMKSMYYWHMGEYEAYQNEKEMFDTCWNELLRDVCERDHAGSGGREEMETWP